MTGDSREPHRREPSGPEDERDARPYEAQRRWICIVTLAQPRPAREEAGRGKEHEHGDPERHARAVHGHRAEALLQRREPDERDEDAQQARRREERPDLGRLNAMEGVRRRAMRVLKTPIGLTFRCKPPTDIGV